jgi:1-phosphofructokinase
MIVTLTPNPALDRTVLIDSLVRGEVHRAHAVRVEAAGKGVNVTRALCSHGVASVAVLPVGGRSGTWYLDALTADGVAVAPVMVEGALRTNVAIVEPDGTTTKINEPGPDLGPDEQDALFAEVSARLQAGASWVVGCGSLPPGADSDLYRRLIGLARDYGVRCAIDSSHAPFLQAISSRPHLIKPNLDELEELVGRGLDTLDAVRTAARELVTGGIETVLISLGARGALLVQQDAVAHAQAAVERPLSTVGAGDAFLAGYLSAVDSSPEKALATGVAWGSAAVALPGTQMPLPAQTSAITVETTDTPDLSTPTRGGI